MPQRDPAARREYNRQYQARRLATEPAFRQRHYQRTAKVSERYRLETAQLIASFRATGCKACGEMTPACLSAHHLDPSLKEFNLGNASRNKMSPERVKAELAKCVCLCLNCHAKLHAGLISL